jgi:hypothetical protein
VLALERRVHRSEKRAVHRFEYIDLSDDIQIGVRNEAALPFATWLRLLRRD